MAFPCMPQRMHACMHACMHASSYYRCVFGNTTTAMGTYTAPTTTTYTNRPFPRTRVQWIMLVNVLHQGKQGTMQMWLDFQGKSTTPITTVTKQSYHALGYQLVKLRLSRWAAQGTDQFYCRWSANTPSSSTLSFTRHPPCLRM